MVDLASLENMLASGQDNAILRFTLGNGFFRQKDYARAAEHLYAAVEHDPGYSAAWKILGRSLYEDGRLDEAAAVYRQGLEAARRKGDKQAEKEMQVFLRRIEK